MHSFCVRVPYGGAGLQREAVVVLQGLTQAGLEQLLQRGPRQSVSAHPVHLHAQLEEQRLHEPRRLREVKTRLSLPGSQQWGVRGVTGGAGTDLHWKTDFGRDAAARLGLFLDLQVLPVCGRGQDGAGGLNLQGGAKLVQQPLQQQEKN